mmetsp:Transcript_1026/g.3248  ORF Transcript_1026/g.3248 Transcript_1026/m.3248 type:complete len:87 (+) Transcript_1026:656-916(+)
MSCLHVMMPKCIFNFHSSHGANHSDFVRIGWFEGGLQLGVSSIPFHGGHGIFHQIPFHEFQQWKFHGIATSLIHESDWSGITRQRY